MKWHRIRTVIRRHAYETRRNLNRVTDVVYWPILDIVVWGFFTIYLSSHETTGGQLVGFLMGAIILWNLFYGFQRDVVVGFLDEFWSRNLTNLFATPLTIKEYLVGLIIVDLVKISVTMIAATLLAWGVYSFNLFAYAWGILPFLLNLLLFALAIGLFSSALILRYSTKVETLAWSFGGLLQPLSCVFYPLAILPAWLAVAAKAVPTAYVFEGMRQVLQGGGVNWTYVITALALNAVYLALAAWFFSTIFQITREKGILVKME